mgnify:CR=1 FL=1
MTIFEVITKALTSHGYKYEDIIDYEDSEYILTFSPLSVDKNTKSCMIFKDSGILKLLNGSVECDEKTYTTMTLTQWLRAINKMEYWIRYVCFKNEISRRDFMEYSEYLENYMLKIAKYNSKFEKYRKIFYSNYILDIDIFGVSIMSFDIILRQPIEVKKQKTSEMTVRKELSDFENKICNDYILKRKLKLSILENCGVYNVIIERNGYNKPAIAFDYGNGFVKYRFIFATDKKYRFLCKGRMNGLFQVRNNNTDICYLVEGESEGITIAEYIDDDIYCMHNTNSLPNDAFIMESLGKYKQIIVKIDKDRYEENKKAFDRIKKLGYNVIIDFKVQELSEDYNSLHIDGKLTFDMIKSINIEEE